ncbi:MAG: branched-chain amino acid ABC transporter permease [Bradyrhizobium sp.]
MNETLSPAMDALPEKPAMISKRTSRSLAAGSVIALVGLPLLTQNAFYLHTGVMIIIHAIAVIGLLIIARVGQLSLCQGAFMSLGAYASALMSMDLHLPVLIAMILAVMFTGIVAAALGTLILRARGVYFTLITFAFGQVINLVLLDFQSITAGAVGITRIPSPALLGFTFDEPGRYYQLSFFLLLLCIVFATRLLRSPIGRAFDSISVNLRLANASGINGQRYQSQAFIIGSMLAGLSGALMGHYIKFIAPGTFEFSLSVTLIVMLVIGGRRTVVGAVLGAAFLTPLPELLRGAPQVQNIIYGLILIVALRVLPDGIASLPDRFKMSMRATKSPRNDT